MFKNRFWPAIAAKDEPADLKAPPVQWLFTQKIQKPPYMLECLATKIYRFLLKVMKFQKNKCPENKRKGANENEPEKWS